MKKLAEAICMVVGVGLLLGASCNRNGSGGLDNRLKVQNNSLGEIYFYYSPTYPDTAISSLNPKRSPAEYKLAAGETGVLMANCCWEGIFERSVPSDTLMIFIFDAKVVESKSWDEIRSEYRVLKRYDLTIKDLESRNWKVVYP